MRKIPLKVLVTGCGRSGTHFMTSLMQAHGIRVNHELYGPDGIVDWKRAAAPDNRARFENVFHVYRHPLPMINSFCTAQQSSWRFIEKKVPRVSRTSDLIIKAAVYWVEWNNFAEVVADVSFKIEDIESAGYDLFHRLGVEFDPEMIAMAARNRSTRDDHDSYGNLQNIADLASMDRQVYDEVSSLMERYGYESAISSHNTVARSH